MCMMLPIELGLETMLVTKTHIHGYTHIQFQFTYKII